MSPTKHGGNESLTSSVFERADEVEEKKQNVLLLAFRGTENAADLSIKEGKKGFSIDHKEVEFNRTVDVVFFSHGAIHPEDKKKVYPTLLHDETRFFEVPQDTRVFEYYNPEEDEDNANAALRPKVDLETVQ